MQTQTIELEGRFFEGTEDQTLRGALIVAFLVDLFLEGNATEDADGNKKNNFLTGALDGVSVRNRGKAWELWERLKGSASWPAFLESHPLGFIYPTFAMATQFYFDAGLDAFALPSSLGVTKFQMLQHVALRGDAWRQERRMAEGPF